LKTILLDVIFLNSTDSSALLLQTYRNIDAFASPIPLKLVRIGLPKFSLMIQVVV
jgi:hypothetical protein